MQARNPLTFHDISFIKHLIFLISFNQISTDFSTPLIHYPAGFHFSMEMASQSKRKRELIAQLFPSL